MKLRKIVCKVLNIPSPLGLQWQLRVLQILQSEAMRWQPPVQQNIFSVV